jgi:hypothetical protein
MGGKILDFKKNCEVYSVKINSSIFVLFLFVFLTAMNYSVLSKTNIYLIPGQGSDFRLFQDLKFDSSFCIHHIKYSLPAKKATIHEFAIELSAQIDTSKPFILIGVSIGGMLVTEMSTFLNPVQTIIISSAKSRKELPFQYRFQKVIPIYKLVPKGLVKFGAKVLQPIVEPDSKTNKETFQAMLSDKDPLFLKRTVKMIIRWDRTLAPVGIIHIHGIKDNTLPYRNIECNFTIPNGSHMLALTKAKTVSILLQEILKTKL